MAMSGLEWGKTWIRRLPHLSTEDRMMLSNLEPDAARSMESLIHEQDRRAKQFPEPVDHTDESLEHRCRPERTQSGRRLPDKVAGPGSGAADLSLRVRALRALLATASGVSSAEPAWDVAALEVLSWYDEATRAFFAALARQRDAGAQTLFVARAAKAAGLSDSTANRRLRELLELVESEWLMPMEKLLAQAA